MNVREEILGQFGLSEDDLDTEGYKGERDQLDIWLEGLEKNQLTVERIKESIEQMKYAVEQELVAEPEITYILFIFPRINRKHLYLKARLKNYLLLEALLTSPERAKEMIGQMLKNIKPKKGAIPNG
jgi:hypothetical protein